MPQPETKTCQNCKNSFVIDASDFAFYGKMGVSAPNLCPDCRFRRRAVFRNERTLYKNKCAMCQRSIITMFNPKSPYTVYCNDCWASDKWDPYSYGQEYDSSRPFFDQLKELSVKVPKSATYSSAESGLNINSEYANFAGGNKDAYLAFNSGPGNENVAYCRGLINSRDTFDTYYGDDLDRIYEGVSVHKSAGVSFGQNVIGSIDSWFLLSCSNCQNCFGCVNLRNKSHYFFNEQLSREEYQRRLLEITGSYLKLEEFKKKFFEFSLKFPRREHNNLKAINCSGDYIFEAKNCHSCFEVSFAEDCGYAFSIKKAKDCYDVIGHGRLSELLLEGVGVGKSSSKVIGSWGVENSHDVGYSIATKGSEYCFGCDAIRKGRYVILNKQYSEEEYKKTESRIIKELREKNLYGAFLPPSLAFFGYNETIGQDNLPLTKEEVLAQGFRWEDDISEVKDQETLKPEEIPDNIHEVQDSILEEILACVECGRNYKLIKAELDFYRRMKIPVPRRCWNCRFLDRIRRRGPFRLYSRKCAKCNKDIQTTYAPDRPEIVYCEQCYNSEVV